MRFVSPFSGGCFEENRSDPKNLWLINELFYYLNRHFSKAATKHVGDKS